MMQLMMTDSLQSEMLISTKFLIGDVDPLDMLIANCQINPGVGD